MALAGLVISILRFKRMEYALALFWLIAGIFPSLITGVVASNLRSIAALPVVYLFVSIGLVEIMRGLERLIESHTLRTIPLVLLAVAVTVFSWNAYFDIWGQARDVRVAYHTTLFEVAQELDRASDIPTDVAVSSIYPNRFHDPYAMQLTLTAQGHAAALVHRVVCRHEWCAACQPDFPAARGRRGVVRDGVNGADRMLQRHHDHAKCFHEHAARRDQLARSQLHSHRPRRRTTTRRSWCRPSRRSILCLPISSSGILKKSDRSSCAPTISIRVSMCIALTPLPR